VTAIDRIAAAELFATLSAEQLRRVAACGEARAVSPGVRLFEIGTEGYELYVILRGQVELTFPLLVLGKTREIRFQLLEPGSTLAWSALVPPHRLTMSARAVTEAELCAFPRKALLGLFVSEPALGLAVTARLAQVVATRLLEFQALWVKEMQRNVAQTYR
jgi:CRP-like cAMP-binding protein